MPLKIALVQMHILPSEPLKNLEKIEKFTAQAREQGADLVVFPEDAVCGPLAGRTAFVRYAPEYLARMQALADRWVYAADSAASAVVGWQIMTDCGLSVSAISGLLTASPLAMREAAGLVRARFCALPELTEGSAPLSWIEGVARLSVYA